MTEQAEENRMSRRTVHLTESGILLSYYGIDYCAE